MKKYPCQEVRRSAILIPRPYSLTPIPVIPQPLKKYFAPSLLVYSKKEAQAKLEFINEHFPKSNLHIDVADGRFVHSTCWCAPANFKKLHIKQPFEVHLMTLYPEKRIAAWKRAGASRMVFHYEATDNPLRVIETIEKHTMEAGIALNLETSPKHIALLLDRLDGILFMAIVPGLTGQQFHPSVIRKIKSFHKKYPKKFIIVDGGISAENAPLLIRAGARQLVSTSAVYGKHFSKS